MTDRERRNSGVHSGIYTAPRPPPKSRNKRRGSSRRSGGSGRFAAFGAGALTLVNAVVRSAVVAAAGAALAYGVVAAHRYFTTSPDFGVHAIRVTGTNRVDPQALIARMDLKNDVNIFDVDVHAAARRGQQDPWVREVRVTRRLPDRLEVAVTEREPALLVALGNLYIADTQGEVFKRLNAGELMDLPVLSGLSREAFRSDEAAVKSRIATALRVVQLYQEVGPTVRAPLSELTVDDDQGVALFIGERAIRVELSATDAGQAKSRIARLAELLDVFEQRGETPQVILLDQRRRTHQATVRLAMR
jgi:cell division protein FtsQ